MTATLSTITKRPVPSRFCGYLYVNRYLPAFVGTHISKRYLPSFTKESRYLHAFLHIASLKFQFIFQSYFNSYFNSKNQKRFDCTNRKAIAKLQNKTCHRVTGFAKNMTTAPSPQMHQGRLCPHPYCRHAAQKTSSAKPERQKQPHRETTSYNRHG